MLINQLLTSRHYLYRHEVASELSECRTAFAVIFELVPIILVIIMRRHDFGRLVVLGTVVLEATMSPCRFGRRLLRDDKLSTERYHVSVVKCFSSYPQTAQHGTRRSTRTDSATTRSLDECAIGQVWRGPRVVCLPVMKSGMCVSLYMCPHESPWCPVVSCGVPCGMRER